MVEFSRHDREDRGGRQARRRTREGSQVVVVVSAMGDTTDELISMAKQLCVLPDDREMDKLLATGEQASSALMAMALHELGAERSRLRAGRPGSSPRAPRARRAS